MSRAAYECQRAEGHLWNASKRGLLRRDTPWFADPQDSERFPAGRFRTADASSFEAAAGPNPGQRDVRSVEMPTVIGARRAVWRRFDNGPISIEVDQFAAIDGPQQAGTAKIHEGAIAVATEQGQSIPT